MFNINETDDTKISEEVIGPILSKISDTGVASRGDLLSLESIVNDYRAPIKLVNSLTNLPSKRNSEILKEYLDDIVVINAKYTVRDVRMLLKEKVETTLPACDESITRLKKCQDFLNTSYVPNKIKNMFQDYTIERAADINIAYFINDDTLVKLYPDIDNCIKLVIGNLLEGSKVSYAILPYARYLTDGDENALSEIQPYITGTIGELVQRYIVDLIWLTQNSVELLSTLDSYIDNYRLHTQYNDSVEKESKTNPTKLYNLISNEQLVFIN